MSSRREEKVRRSCGVEGVAGPHPAVHQAKPDTRPHKHLRVDVCVSVTPAAKERGRGVSSACGVRAEGRPG